MSAEEKSEAMNRLKTVEQEVIFKVATELIVNLGHCLGQAEANDKKHQPSTTNVWGLAATVQSRCMVMDILSLILT